MNEQAKPLADATETADGSYHYSGNGSKQFWLRVNSLKKDTDREVLYSLGCALQDLEDRVLNQLQNAEERQSPASEASARSPLKRLSAVDAKNLELLQKVQHLESKLQGAEVALNLVDPKGELRQIMKTFLAEDSGA